MSLPNMWNRVLRGKASSRRRQQTHGSSVDRCKDWEYVRHLESLNRRHFLENLARAIRTESSLAIQLWWKVRQETVWRWRKAFGVTQWGTQGSRRLHQALSENGATKLRGKKRPVAAIRRQIKTCRERGYKPPQKRWAKTGWKQWQLDLLGTAPDAELAVRFGRSRSAVRAMRWKLGRRAP
jgi:hypothetical protein